jgi:hypothetical protein
LSAGPAGRLEGKQPLGAETDDPSGPAESGYFATTGSS